jgi:hypothetical protein
MTIATGGSWGRLVGALLVLSAAAAPAAQAQGLSETAVIVQPTFTSFNFGSGGEKRTVQQIALPIVFGIPISERFSIDVTTAYAVSDVLVDGSSESSISGLTDTQVRANFRAGDRQLVFTIGINLPTGQYEVPEEQQEAAGQIGNDFLNYPISSMGNGLAGTGGVAYAVPAGVWNIGTGASVRKSTEFAAFSVAASEVRFTPADEYRLSVSADRPLGDGELNVGLTYSVFGEDFADNTTYSTGDRFIASGGWSFPYRGTDVFLSAWNLYRLEGEQYGGPAPPENVFNVAGAVSIPLGTGLLLQPSAEIRLWQVDGARAGNMFNFGARLRIPTNTFVLYPQLGLSLGNIYALGDGAAKNVTGLRASLTVRYN